MLHKLKSLNPEVELVSDVMILMNIYIAKMNVLPKYKGKKY